MRSVADAVGEYENENRNDFNGLNDIEIYYQVIVYNVDIERTILVRLGALCTSACVTA